jgi:hypothetical protein
LQPADAFDLIRWLARSQNDPRKAVAELVQNAIDANAKTIAIERRRRGRRSALVVRDDGEGIRPTEDRETALRYIATHIGRSHKRNLSARERHEQMVAGQYGPDGRSHPSCERVDPRPDDRRHRARRAQSVATLAVNAHSRVDGFAIALRR